MALDQATVESWIHARRSFSGLAIGPLDLRGRAFDYRPDFTGCKFEGAVDFEAAVFADGADFARASLRAANFRGTHFAGNATFTEATFAGPAEFSWARFGALAWFWKTVFGAPATFLHADFAGDANFSWAYFTPKSGASDVAEANFSDAKFHADAYFWRTLFRGRANFSQAKFDAGAVFEGSPWKICISKWDLLQSRAGNPELIFRRLFDAGIVTQDIEGDGYADFDETIEMADDLRDRLEKAQIQPPARDAIVQYWLAHHEPTFSPTSEHTFEGVSFNRPERVKFLRVNLERCRFMHTDLSAVDFTEVGWDRRPVTGMSCLYDERFVGRRRSPELVGKLYRQLRKNYEASGRYGEAGDFYYGEMEMRRVARPIVPRYLSLTAAYWYLCGYGRIVWLPALWLIFAMFVAFPVLYLVADQWTAPGGYVNALLYSIENSTFQGPLVPATVTAWGILVGALQKIVVPILATLLVLTITRTFRR